MNWKKIICPLVALAVSAALCYVSAAAAVVEEYPIAAKYQQDLAITALTAREGGSLDYFSRSSEKKQHLMVPLQYHSFDGGKTWNTVDLSGYKNYLTKNYPEAGETSNIYMAQNGDIYFTTITSLDEKVEGSNHFTYRNYGVFKYSGGQVSEIIPLRMGNFAASGIKVCGVTPSGDVIALQRTESLGMLAGTIKTPPNKICYYSAKTNTASKVDMVIESPREWKPHVYANQTLFGIRSREQVFIEGYDIKTGKLSISIPLTELPKDEHRSVSICTDSKDNLYVLSASGIYILKPGSKQLQKIMDVSSTRLGKNACSFGSPAYGPDGSLYAPTRYRNGKKAGNADGDVDGKILRFVLPTGV